VSRLRFCLETKKSYEECLAIKPEFADAHHNLAILLDKRGDRRGLVRHLSAYRKLMEKSIAT
jgi:hypothetical protein